MTTIIKPLIDANISKEKLSSYENYIKIAIRCAEQIFTADQWAEKKEYVYTFAMIKAKEIGIDISETEIDILIEGFVNEIKKGILIA